MWKSKATAFYGAFKKTLFGGTKPFFKEFFFFFKIVVCSLYVQLRLWEKKKVSKHILRRVLTFMYGSTLYGVTELN